jgi:hypothetical protein
MKKAGQLLALYSAVLSGSFGTAAQPPGPIEEFPVVAGTPDAPDPASQDRGGAAAVTAASFSPLFRQYRASPCHS